MNCKPNQTYFLYHFVENIFHRLITTDQIDPCPPKGETRQNIAPLVKMYVPLNDVVAKSPIFIARELWNSQTPVVRSIVDHKLFKNTIHSYINKDYIASEIARITAGLFL